MGSCPAEGNMSWWLGGGGGGGSPGWDIVVLVESHPDGICSGGSCPVGRCPTTFVLLWNILSSQICFFMSSNMLVFGSV